jgi:hypothetical protein
VIEPRNPEPVSSADLHGATLGLRRLLARRALWHTVGLLVAAALAWLIMRAYRNPDLLLELSALRLC